VHTVRSASILDAEEIACIQIASYHSAYVGVFPPDYLAQFSLEEQTQGCRSLMLWVLARSPSRGFYEHLDGVYLIARSFEIDEAGTLAEEVAYGWEDIRALLPGRPA
jgi:hypothetical protein